LTTAEKRRILLNNIYGVDIDPQAVEVTKLSLLLKVLEGENEGSLGQQLAFFQERALPDLGSNIKCGNSLIGPDFYTQDGRQLALLDTKEMYRINAFDWQAEFAGVFAGGGFDAVIGNPPYLFITELRKSDKDYFSTIFKTYSYRYDVYGLFIEKCIDNLIKNRGRFGFIIPHTLLNNDSFKHLRHLILRKTSVNQIIDLGPGVFQNAKNETMLLFFENAQPTKEHMCEIVKSDNHLSGLDNLEKVAQNWFLEMPKSPILLVTTQAAISILDKLRRIELTLGDVCTINQGLRTGNNQKFLSTEKYLDSHYPVVGGKNIDRYLVRDFIYVQYEPKLLDAPRKKSIFTSKEKLIAQEVRNITLPRRLIVAYDDDQLFSLQTTNAINIRHDFEQPISIKYLLGLINSSIHNWFFRLNFPSNNHIASNQLSQLPIRTIDFSNPTDTTRHDKMVTLVETMIELHKSLAAARTPTEKQILQRQIDTTDSQIDALVYDLYDLTDDEIRIVEES
jgi:methylase of polypeptide subunit release factors